MNLPELRKIVHELYGGGVEVSPTVIKRDGVLVVRVSSNSRAVTSHAAALVARLRTRGIQSEASVFEGRRGLYNAVWAEAKIVG